MTEKKTGEVGQVGTHDINTLSQLFLVNQSHFDDRINKKQLSSLTSGAAGARPANSRRNLAHHGGRRAAVAGAITVAGAIMVAEVIVVGECGSRG
jgi:hypothetical protein